MIPLQLQDAKFRFIRTNGKIPIDKDWHKDRNFCFNDERLQSHINIHKTYGLATGYGNLVVVDLDNAAVNQAIVDGKLFPNTFTIKTAGKGLNHFYFFADDTKSFKILDADKKTIADVQGEGKQVIAPNSIINSKKYEVVNDAPIATIKMSYIREMLEKFGNLVKKEEKVAKWQKIITPDQTVEEIKNKVSIELVLMEAGIDCVTNPTRCPLHPSEKGKCLHITNKLWHCFHCEKGGSVLDLYMEMNHCDFPTAKNKLMEKAGIKSEVKKREHKEDSITEISKFYLTNPFFYDKNRIWWVWNEEEKAWDMCDEVDLLNRFDPEIENYSTINSKLRNEILEVMKRTGRKKKPKEVPNTWIQFKNKIIDFKDGLEHVPSPEFFITNPIPWEIGEYEDTPTIDKIFTEWVGEESKKTLYQIVAYCMLSDYPLHRIFCFMGGGSNGKSKFLELINRFIGENNTCSTDLDLLISSRFEVSKLYHKLVCQMGETDFNNMSRTGRLKKLSGQDKNSIEIKNKNPFDFVNYAKILISTNGLPQTNDTTDGFFRRWVLIDFPNQFSEKKDILSDIPECEYNNLARKSIYILKDLLNNREFFGEGTIDFRRKRYQERSNPLRKFLSEECEEDSESHYFKFELTKDFEAWCKNKGFRVYSDNEIGKAMSENFDEKKCEYKGWDKNSNTFASKWYRAWMGLKKRGSLSVGGSESSIGNEGGVFSSKINENVVKSEKNNVISGISDFSGQRVVGFRNVNASSVGVENPENPEIFNGAIYNTITEEVVSIGNQGQSVKGTQNSLVLVENTPSFPMEKSLIKNADIHYKCVFCDLTPCIAWNKSGQPVCEFCAESLQKNGEYVSYQQ